MSSKQMWTMRPPRKFRPPKKENSRGENEGQGRCGSGERETIDASNNADMSVHVKELNTYHGFKNMLPDTIVLSVPYLLPDLWAVGLDQVRLNGPIIPTMMSKATCSKRTEEMDTCKEG